MNSAKLREKWKDPVYREHMRVAHLGKTKGKKYPKSFGLKISKSLTGKKLSEKHRENLSKSHLGKKQPWKSGSNHWNWKGGATEINSQIRNSLEYKIWRRSVFERDSYSCLWCKTHKNLTADHIKPFSMFPELRFAVDNGRTLCLNCHKKTDTWGWRVKTYESISS